MQISDFSIFFYWQEGFEVNRLLKLKPVNEN